MMKSGGGVPLFGSFGSDVSMCPYRVCHRFCGEAQVCIVQSANSEGWPKERKDDTHKSRNVSVPEVPFPRLRFGMPCCVDKIFQVKIFCCSLLALVLKVRRAVIGHSQVMSPKVTLN